MNQRPVVLRALARRDVDEAIDFYIAEAGVAVAARFIDALQAALRAIGTRPAAGSALYAQELGLPGLRSLLPTRWRRNRRPGH